MTQFFNQTLDDQLIWQEILGAKNLQLVRMRQQLRGLALDSRGAEPEWNGEGERAALPELTGQMNFTPHQIYDLPTNGKPKACATEAPGG
jgi:hypothetical protein